MGLFDKLFGKKAPPPRPPELTPEERAAQRAKTVDNIVWMIGDELNRFPGWMVAQYAKGQVQGFDANNIYAEQSKIETAIETIIGDLRARVPEPEAQAQIDKVKKDTLDRTMSLLRVVPTGGIAG